MCNVEGPPLKKRKPQPLHFTDPKPIYLDYNATTPLCEEAWQAMVGVHKVGGNPSSTHPFGFEAKYYLEKSRKELSDVLGAKGPENVIFTSGGTESNNLAIIGGAQTVARKEPKRKYIISTNLEHPAVSEVLKHLAGHEFSFKLYPVCQECGSVHPTEFEAFLKTDIPGGPECVAVVTIMFANNEIGAINPIKELVAVVKQSCGDSCLFHTDAAQALGKVPVNVSDLNVDLLSVCGHKFYAPKGSGALYIRSGIQLNNITFGAGHEGGVRPGTENVLIATGMTRALCYAVENIKAFTSNMQSCRDELMNVLRTELHKNNMDFIINGDIQVALPNTLNCAIYKKIPNHKTKAPITFISAQRLIFAAGDKVCISAGSACHSTTDGEVEVSAPLKAVNVSLERAIGTLRISTGRETTLSDVRRAARIIASTAAQQFGE